MCTHIWQWQWTCARVHIYICIYIYMKRVCEADARPLPKQRVKGHKPDVATKINNTNNASKASNAILNNTKHERHATP